MHGSVTGQTLSLIIDCIFLLALLVVATYQYIRAPKPHLRGLLGLIVLIIIIGLYLPAIIFFLRTPSYNHSSYVLVFLTGLTPLGSIWAIYYLTIPPQRSRNWTIYASLFLGLIVTSLLLSWIFPQWFN